MSQDSGRVAQKVDYFTLYHTFCAGLLSSKQITTELKNSAHKLMLLWYKLNKD